MRKTTNLDDIRIFVAAAESGTFSRAAVDLHLPPSTISRSLTRLEKHLDLLLVRRSQRGLTLTDAGKEYLVSCRSALRLLREGRELLDKHRASPSGLLRIACPITMGRDLIAPLLSQFMEAFPELRVQLEIYSSDFGQEPKEDIDVFFKVRAPKDSSRRVRSYPGVARGIFASRRYVETAGKPAEPADLTSHRCIGSGRWILSREGRTLTPDVAPRLVTDDPVVHRELVLDAAGMAISFGVGMAMGAAWGGGWGWNTGWGGNNDININRNNTFVNNSNRQGVNRAGNTRGGNTWQHNPQHRGGAPYPNRATASQFNGTARGDSLSSRQANARQNVGANRSGTAGTNRAGTAGTNRAGTAGTNRAGTAGSLPQSSRASAGG